MYSRVGVKSPELALVQNAVGRAIAGIPEPTALSFGDPRIISASQPIRFGDFLIASSTSVITLPQIFSTRIGQHVSLGAMAGVTVTAVPFSGQLINGSASPYSLAGGASWASITLVAVDGYRWMVM